MLNEDLIRVYDHLSKNGLIYLLVNDTGVLFAEAPETQGLDDEAPQENLIRFFLTNNECNSYRSSIEQFVDVDLFIAPYTLDKLWKYIRNIRLKQLVVRVAVCCIDASGFAYELDTLFTDYLLLN